VQENLPGIGRPCPMVWVIAKYRDAASAELELDVLSEAHKLLVGAHAACPDPELYGPLATAMQHTVDWLRSVATEVSG